MPSNQAAWQPSKASKTLHVKTAPYTPAGRNEIVVRNKAVAINPLDYLKQELGNKMFSWVKYPFILGVDLAGEVVEVGEGVTRFAVGDRILGHATGLEPKVNKASEGAFQEYMVIRAQLAAPIPSSVSFEQACVLPLCLSTAASGLHQKDYLALPYPSIIPKPTGKTILIWGGSTSVGSNAIQLSVASGFEVITTCSPKNFDYVKKLGASHAFDYKSATVVENITELYKTRECAGASSIGNGALSACISILAASKGRKFIAQANPSGDLPERLPTNLLGWVPVGISMGIQSASNSLSATLKGVDRKFIWGADLMWNEVSKVIYEDFLPKALEEGRYLPAPEPLIVGKG